MQVQARGGGGGGWGAVRFKSAQLPMGMTSVVAAAVVPPSEVPRETATSPSCWVLIANQIPSLFRAATGGYRYE